MVEMEGGEFVMGSDSADADPDEQPVLTEACVDPFWIDEHEVTIAEYTDCVTAGSCNFPDTTEACNWGVAGRENHPVNCVSWNNADDYCEWIGKRLPTEAEWEFAARGHDARVYPWGDAPAPDCEYAVMNEGTGNGCGLGITAPVGSTSPMGDTPEGVQDMAGNVWEWTANLEWFYDDTTECPPTGEEMAPRRVLRGGAWSHLQAADFRTSERNPTNPSLRFNSFGFRCAWSPE